MSKFLDSTAPFKPINPWGKAMPKPQGGYNSDRPKLFQIAVDVVRPTGEIETIRVFPKMEKTFAEDYLEVVSREIIKGKETSWANPRLVAG